jgi:hypothetical protein
MYILAKRKLVRGEIGRNRAADAEQQRFGSITRAIYSDVESARWKPSHIAMLVQRFYITGTASTSSSQQFRALWTHYKRLHRAAAGA